MEDLTVIRLGLLGILMVELLGINTALASRINPQPPKAAMSYVLTAKVKRVAGVGRLRFAPIKDLRQIKGESKQQFLIRVGAELNKFSTVTNYEGCGRLARHADGSYSIRLHTNLSHKGCIVLSSYVLADFEPINDLIHSHPVRSPVVFTKDDAVLAKGEAYAGMRVDVVTKTFSLQDYDIGAGWLVADGKLMWQNGKGTEKIIHTYTQE